MKAIFSFKIVASKKENLKNELNEEERKVLIKYLTKKYSKRFNPIGLHAENFFKNKENWPLNLNLTRSLQDIKTCLLETENVKEKAHSLRLVSKYLPMEQQNLETILANKREEYIYFSRQNNLSEETNPVANSHKSNISQIIQKDVQRTLSEWRIFQNPIIKRALINVLNAYAMRHPFHEYIQGMNDILAPVFAVFLCEKFHMDIIQLENNSEEMERILTGVSLKDVEADSFFVFSALLERINRNLLKDFVGIHKLLGILEELIANCAPKLSVFFKTEGIELIHFSFRWLFCLLVREFPFFLSMKLMGYYFVASENPQEICLYFCMVLLIMYQTVILKMDRDGTIMFLQKLPTDSWGFDDVEMLFMEASSLRNIVKPMLMTRSAEYRDYFA